MFNKVKAEMKKELETLKAKLEKLQAKMNEEIAAFNAAKSEVSFLAIDDISEVEADAIAELDALIADAE